MHVTIRPFLPSQISPILAAVFVLFSLMSCKQRSTAPTPTSSLRHVLGKTSVTPQHEFEPCSPASEFVDAASYFEKIARHIMTKNPKTFEGPYCPELFCIHARNVSHLNAVSSEKSRLIAANTGLLSMADDQVDADIAMAIAHELAHITLQHSERDPTLSELPDDIDAKELDRRLRLRAVFRDKKLSLRKSIAVNAHVDQIFNDYIWLVVAIEEISSALKPLIKSREASSLELAGKRAAKLHSSFASVLGDSTTKNQSENEANFMIQSRPLIQSLTEDIGSISAAIKNVGNCMAPSPCEVLNRLGKVANYQKIRVQPIALQLNELFMPLEDNPDAYPPYAQWMEQQADEVGYELYLRAGFKPERFETYFKAALKLKSEISTDECLKKIKNSSIPDRTEDEDLDRSHPSRCFRFYNINVTEMLRHNDAYKELAEQATILNIPETDGELKALRGIYGPAE